MKIFTHYYKSPDIPADTWLKGQADSKNAKISFVRAFVCGWSWIISVPGMKITNQITNHNPIAFKAIYI